jgi:hypothetical protein
VHGDFAAEIFVFLRIWLPRHDESLLIEIPCLQQEFQNSEGASREENAIMALETVN